MNKAPTKLTVLFTGLLLAGGCSFRLHIGFSSKKKNAPKPPHPIRFTQTQAGYIAEDEGRQVFFYRTKPKSLAGKYCRADYIHPLCGLDGEILTEDFPEDHRHHRGIFWAWHQNYIRDKAVGDSWSLKDFICDVRQVKILDIDCKSRALQATVYWKSPLWKKNSGDLEPFVKQTTNIRVYHTVGDIQKIDFEISLLALEEGFRIGGSDNKKGYGGFSARIRLPDEMQFTGTFGQVEPQRTSVQAGPWMDFSGAFRADGNISGLAVLNHISNPGFPRRWILRRKHSMQNAVWPGREPVILSTKEPVVLRYRLIIHQGDALSVNLDKLQQEYNQNLN